MFKIHKKKECSKHKINYLKLNEKVLNAILSQIEVALDYRNLVDNFNISESKKSSQQNQKASIKSLNLKLLGLQRKRTRLYEDFAKGVLGTDEYAFAKKNYDEEYYRLQGLLVDEPLSNNNKWLNLIKSVGKSKVLTQNLVDNMIEKVLVYENGDVEITMKCTDVYATYKENIGYISEV